MKNNDPHALITCRTDRELRALEVNLTDAPDSPHKKAVTEAIDAEKAKRAKR
ncbi:hypothetical protein ACWDOR_11735 [Streptosporangium canum]